MGAKDSETPENIFQKLNDCETELKEKIVMNKDKHTKLWNKIRPEILASKQEKIEYLLDEFGTKEPCNRFDVGNCIEFIISEMLTECNLSVKELPNAKRVDIVIKDYGPLSVKYSSAGYITLHNSNSCINKDEEMTDLILLTPENLFLITNDSLKDYNVDIKEFTKNAGDSLKLKRKILTHLKNIKYPFIMNFKLNIDKTKCKNRLTSKVFYEKFSEEFKKKSIREKNLKKKSKKSTNKNTYNV